MLFRLRVLQKARLILLTYLPNGLLYDTASVKFDDYLII